MQIEKKGSVSVALIYFCLCLIPGAVLAQAKLEMWKDELPIRQPWLRDHLPDNALGYVRIPQLLGLLATPKGNSLDPALRSKANVANILRLKKAIGENVLEYLPMFEDLHDVMHKHGMMQRLAPNGAQLWLDGMKAGLERFSRLKLHSSCPRRQQA